MKRAGYHVDPQSDLSGFTDSDLLPEKKLAAAVVARALLDLDVRTTPGEEVTRRTIRKDAKRWLLTEGSDPWSLQWCVTHIVETHHLADTIIKQIRDHAKRGSAPRTTKAQLLRVLSSRKDQRSVQTD